jgi:hypothetical protein
MAKPRGRNWLIEEEKRKTAIELSVPTTSINGTFGGNKKIGNEENDPKMPKQKYFEVFF